MRLWLKRLALAALGVVALYLGGVNLLLNTPVGRRLANPRPERLAVDWRCAWSLWPGDLRVTALAVEGHSRRLGWRLEVDRARGRIELAGLLHRRLHVVELHGQGVAERTWLDEGVEPPPRPPSRHPWSLLFDTIVLDRVREVAHGELRLAGEGRAEGSFSSVLGGDFTLPELRLEMASGRLLAGAGEIAGDLVVAADLSVAPYPPREHPGLAGLDFVSGTLTAHGSVPEWPRLAGLQTAGGEPPTIPGAFTAEMRIEAGELTPGSRLSLTTPRPAAGEPSTASLEVAVDGGTPRLRVAFDAPGFTIPRRDGGPPWLTAASLRVSTSTAERRVSRLLAGAGTLSAGETGSDPAGGSAGQADLGPLAGDFTATGFTLTTGRNRLIWRFAVDRAAGRIDLPALLRREVRLSGVHGTGVVSTMTPRRAPASGATPTGKRWAVTLTDAAFGQLREVTVGDSTTTGDGTLEGGLVYAADGTLTVPAAALAIPDGRMRVAGSEAARKLDLRLTGRLDPFTPGELTGAATLRVFSGTLTVDGQVESLGFLRHYLASTPWLTLVGSGRLSGELRVAAGRLLPGSRFEVPAAKVAATILDDVATGTARVSGRVAEEPGGPRARLSVDFDRFELAPAGTAGASGQTYLRGRGLRVAAVSSALDLAAPAADVQAEVDLADSEVPDLTVYNAYLPDRAGVAFLGGRGQLRLHLDLDGGSQTGAGTIDLTSDAFRLQFKDQQLSGRLALHTRLASSDLAGRRFDLGGTRLDVDRVRLRDEDGEASASDEWWAHLAVPKGSMVWSKPLALDGTLAVEMKDADLLLALFAQRKRYLRWFADALELKDLAAEGRVRLAANAIEIDPFTATGGKLTLRSRMRFAQGSQQGDLLVRYGVLAVGIALRNGERDFKFIRPQHWFESLGGFEGATPSPP